MQDEKKGHTTKERGRGILQKKVDKRDEGEREEPEGNEELEDK